MGNTIFESPFYLPVNCLYNVLNAGMIAAIVVNGCCKCSNAIGRFHNVLCLSGLD